MKLNSRVNILTERVLRIVYQDNASSFTELLHKENFDNYTQQKYPVVNYWNI